MIEIIQGINHYFQLWYSLYTDFFIVHYLTWKIYVQTMFFFVYFFGKMKFPDSKEFKYNRKKLLFPSFQMWVSELRCVFCFAQYSKKTPQQYDRGKKMFDFVQFRSLIERKVKSNKYPVFLLCNRVRREGEREKAAKIKFY